MARGDKPVELRPVDEEVEMPEDVVRLANDHSEVNAPVRLKVHPKEHEEEKRRLEIVPKELMSSRTFEPGIEALIEPPEAVQAQADPEWGGQGDRHAIPWGWFALIALVLCGAVTWSLTRVQHAEKMSRKIATETKSMLGKDAAEAKEAEKLIDRIEYVTHEFFRAQTVADMAKWVRQPQRVAPLMAKYYADHRLVSQRVTRTDLMQPLTLGDRANFWRETVELESEGKRSLALEVMPTGEIKIDWETLVCYQPMPWDQFATERPEGVSLDFRVHVEADNFRSHEFTDANVWECYRLTALDSDETLFGYCRKNTEAATLLANAMAANQGAKAPVILRLNIPTGLQSRRGVVIEQVLSLRWIYIEPPDPNL